MIDYQDLRDNPAKYRKAVELKNKEVDVDRVLELGEQRLALQKKIEDLKAQSNKIAAEIKEFVAARGNKPPQELIDQGKSLKTEIKQTETGLEPIASEFTQLLKKIPNPPSADTPIGKDDSDNVVIREWGKRRDFAAEGFEPKEHWELAEALGLVDSERAVKVSGARFVYLKGALVQLQFAIMQLVMTKLTSQEYIAGVIKKANLDLPPTPFTPVVPPVIINPEPMSRMARLEPHEERYHLDQDDQYLVGSAEHTLGPMYMDEILDENELPIRYLGYSTSFRREAGSYGKDTKGILRLHQFDKLEMEVFSTPETSFAEQDLLVAIQEDLMQTLELPYQVMLVCTGDMGGPDHRQIDINTWLPGQDKYRETHSADLMTDYQSRGLNTRVRRKSKQNQEEGQGQNQGEKQFVHMNDATAFAIGRILIGIIENYQQKDGSILIPKSLQDLVGLKKIG